MGVVVSFPTKGRAVGRRRAWILAAAGAGAAFLTAIGVVLAGQDLLRGAQADPPLEAGGRLSRPVAASPDQAAVSWRGASRAIQLAHSAGRSEAVVATGADAP